MSDDFLADLETVEGKLKVRKLFMSVVDILVGDSEIPSHVPCIGEVR